MLLRIVVLATCLAFQVACLKVPRLGPVGAYHSYNRAQKMDSFPSCENRIREAKLNNFTPKEQQKIATAMQPPQADRSLSRATCTNTIAQLQHARGQCDKARANYEDAALLYEKLGYMKDAKIAWDGATAIRTEGCSQRAASPKT